MSEKPISLDHPQIPQSARACRSVVLRVLQHLTEGCLIIKEEGATILEAGSSQSSLRAEVNIVDPRFYRRALLGGSVGMGEAFVEGYWETADLTSVVRIFARNLSLLDNLERRHGWLMKPLKLLRSVKRRNTQKQAKRNILSHYDLGNNLYRAFLDSRMQYSSALFNNPGDSLEQAQIAKLTRICEQLKLGPNDHLLEIGSGWGGLAIFAAKHYGCQVTTTTISDAQYEYAQEAIKTAGLESQVHLLKQDYREMTGVYDKAVSIEMVEAVGERFLPNYFEKVDALLKPNGLFMIQAITIADQRYRYYEQSEDFIRKHIFPGGFLPSLSVLAQSLARNSAMVVRDVHDMGKDYADTLMHWRNKLLEHSGKLMPQGYDDRFMRLWLYYFGYCEGGFRERRISTVQLLASKAPHL